MRLISRTPIAASAPVSVTDLADHLRIETDEVVSGIRYATAAARELEAYADLALLDTEIVAEGVPERGVMLYLPVGPAQAQAATVEDADGTALPHLFTPGARPVVTLDEPHDGPVRVTYQAGFGADETALPRDLSLAILDQALRLYDKRGDMDNSPGLAPSTARICARYRRVSVGALMGAATRQPHYTGRSGALCVHLVPMPRLSLWTETGGDTFLFALCEVAR